MTRIIGAEGARNLLELLRGRVTAHSDAVVFVVTKALAEDEGRNAMVGEALKASARNALVLVRVDDAEAPIGLRDMNAVIWRPQESDSDREIEEVASAVWAVTPESGAAAGGPVEVGASPSAGASGPRHAPSGSGFSLDRMTPKQMVAAGGALVAVLAVLILLSKHYDHPAPTAAPTNGTVAAAPPPQTAGAEGPTVGAEAPTVGAEAPNDSLNSPAPTVGGAEPAPPPPVTATTQPPSPEPAATKPKGQGGVAVLLSLIVILLLALVAIQGLMLATMVKGGEWLEERLGKVLAVLPIKRAAAAKPQQAAKPAEAAGAPTHGKGAMVFASYSRKDRETVDGLILDIEREGLPVWLDRIDIGGGAIWPEAIVQAIRGAKMVVIFCSPNAFNSDNVLREINLAASYAKPILPIVLSPAAVPDSFLYYLATCQFVDMSADEHWRDKVMQTLKAAA